MRFLGWLGVLDYMVNWIWGSGRWIVDVRRKIQRAEYREVLPYAFRWQSRPLHFREAQDELRRAVAVIESGRWPERESIYRQQ